MVLLALGLASAVTVWAAVIITNAASVPFTVTFNMPVAGVDATASALTTTGDQDGATLGTVSGSDET